MGLGSQPHSGIATLAAPPAAVDPSISGRPSGPRREVWLDLRLPPLADLRHLPPGQRDAAMAALEQQQASVLERVQTLGGHELARVRVVRNALAVSVPAARLGEVAAIEGVVRVRAIEHRARVLPAAGAGTSTPGH